MPMPIRPVVAVGLLAALLSGCSGSSGSGGGGSDGPSFDEVDAAAMSLFDEAVALPLTDPAALPASGSATYDGYIGMTVFDDAEDPTILLGDMSLGVEFGNPVYEGTDGNVTGSASNFVNQRDESFGGQIQVLGGALQYEGTQFGSQTIVFDLTGTLDGPNGNEWAFDGLALGDFTGPDHSHVVGGHEGDVTIEGVGDTSYAGGFALER